MDLVGSPAEALHTCTVRNSSYKQYECIMNIFHLLRPEYKNKNVRQQKHIERTYPLTLRNTSFSTLFAFAKNVANCSE